MSSSSAPFSLWFSQLFFACCGCRTSLQVAPFHEGAMLPRASTCDRTLFLPAYATHRELHDALVLAYDLERGGGFYEHKDY